MPSSKRAFWLYPLFKVPLLALIGCLIALTLFGLLGLGRPRVAVSIALDLSNSTYQSQLFNAPGTVMHQEVQAVQSYLQKNSQQLRTPNQIQVFGFGGAVQPLVGSFQTDSEKIETDLLKALKDPALPKAVQPSQTNLNLVTRRGIDELIAMNGYCRELLLVTDGQTPLSQDLINEAVSSRIKLNSVIVGAEAAALQNAAIATNGIYLANAARNLDELFTEKLFVQFNTNIRWIIFWLGAAWIAFVWMLTLPLDRWIFQRMLKLPMHLAGKLALSHSLFWTTTTLIVIWRLTSGIPFISQC